MMRQVPDGPSVQPQYPKRPISRVDLLTVLTHEFGHLLGLDDDVSDSSIGSVMTSDCSRSCGN